MTTLDRDLVMIGRISGVYGVKGWVRVFSYTQPKENILNYSPWLIKHRQGEEWQDISLEDGRSHGKGIIAKLEGVTDRDQATALMDTEIAIRQEQLAALGKNEFYWADLIGLAVFNQDNLPLGKVAKLIETGANDVLVVKGVEEEILIPFAIPQVIKDCDLEAGRIVVDWQPDY